MYPDIPLVESALILFGGLWLLSWSADRFVVYAASAAHRCRVSPFVVGLVVIGFGTSLPELAVSVMAAQARHTDLSLGNVYGSNICNIAVVFGLMAMIRPIRIGRSIRRVAIPLLVAGTAFVWLLLAVTGGVSRTWGAVLLAVFAGAVFLMVRLNAGMGRMPGGANRSDVEWSWRGCCITLLLLLLASHLVVWGGVAAARRLGVPELAIGLSVIALGTSLPELVTALAAVRRHEPGLVVGNVVGSNLFNGLFIVGASALVHPLAEASSALVWRDLPATLLFTLLLFVRRVRCRHGLLALLAYAVYLALAF